MRGLQHKKRIQQFEENNSSLNLIMGANNPNWIIWNFILIISCEGYDTDYPKP